MYVLLCRLPREPISAPGGLKEIKGLTGLSVCVCCDAVCCLRVLLRVACGFGLFCGACAVVQEKPLLLREPQVSLGA